MMKANFLILTLLTLTLGFTGCNNDDNGPKVSGETKNVRLKLSQDIQTKAEVAPVASGAVTTINDGYLFFTDNTTDTVIVNRITLDAAAITELTSAAGKTIEVPTEAKFVYMVANLHTTDLIPGLGKKLSDIKALGISAAQQTGASADEDQVTLSSLELKAPLTAIGASTTEFEATVQLTPIASRFEIKKFTCTGAITDYRVDGIFINNFYSPMALGRDFASSTPQSFSADSLFKEVYIYSLASDPNKGLHDYNATSGLGATVSKVLSPTAGNVWAYNVPIPAATIGANMPQIVIRLANITPAEYANNKFVTVRYFKDAGTGADVKLEPGKIYQIDDVTFSEDNMTVDPIDPNQTFVSATVKVSVLPWVAQKINPVF